eukprot:jgi/Mesen1/7546/ME000392S06814
MHACVCETTICFFNSQQGECLLNSSLSPRRGKASSHGGILRSRFPLVSNDTSHELLHCSLRSNKPFIQPQIGQIQSPTESTRLLKYGAPQSASGDINAEVSRERDEGASTGAEGASLTRAQSKAESEAESTAGFKQLSSGSPEGGSAKAEETSVEKPYAIDTLRAAEPGASDRFSGAAGEDLTSNGEEEVEEEEGAGLDWEPPDGKTLRRWFRYQTRVSRGIQRVYPGQ